MKLRILIFASGVLIFIWFVTWLIKTGLCSTDTMKQNLKNKDASKSAGREMFFDPAKSLGNLRCIVINSRKNIDVEKKEENDEPIPERSMMCVRQPNPNELCVGDACMSASNFRSLIGIKQRYLKKMDELENERMTQINDVDDQVRTRLAARIDVLQRKIDHAKFLTLRQKDNLRQAAELKPQLKTKLQERTGRLFESGVGSGSSSTVDAEGGDKEYDFDGFHVHVFKSSGTFTVNRGGAADILVVAGGGGSLSNGRDTAGGGAGGLVLRPSVILASDTTYSVRVGKGGTRGKNGESSKFNGNDTSLKAFGGGGVQGNGSGTAGGSGSGAGRSGGNGGRATQPGQSGMNGWFGHGHRGGDNSGRGSEGAGGGGAGEPGHNYTSSGSKRSGFRVKRGGDGIDLSMVFGSDVGDDGWFAGGGGGGGARGSGSLEETRGGKGGGGRGGHPSWNRDGGDGMANTGGGGGGADNREGGVGGSGVVIVRYPKDQKQSISAKASGGDMERYIGIPDTTESYRTHYFTSSGEFNVEKGGIAEVIVVAGGGSGGVGGGAEGGGGGGGGGVLHRKAYYLTPGTVRVRVGKGGPAVRGARTDGRPGQDSSFGDLEATGGGFGGGRGSSGGDGGSGGGTRGAHRDRQGGSGIDGQGHDGGKGGWRNGGSGGGGARSAGSSTTNNRGGNGGRGIFFRHLFSNNPSDSENRVGFGGGGGGGARYRSWNGGRVHRGNLLFGGGAGGGRNRRGHISSDGRHALSNKGGGGGGAISGNHRSGRGASGMVIIRYVYNKGA